MDISEAVNRSVSEQYNFPELINSDAGLGKVEELGVMGIPSWQRTGVVRKRKVVLEIRTFKGISSNAIHYYGKIVADGVYVGDINDTTKPKTLSYKQEEQYPLLNYKYEFKVLRPITEKEIKTYPDRFYMYKAGDLIEGFESMSELVDDGIKILKLRFVGDWEYIIQYPAGRKELV